MPYTPLGEADLHASLDHGLLSTASIPNVPAADARLAIVSEKFGQR